MCFNVFSQKICPLALRANSATVPAIVWLIRCLTEWLLTNIPDITYTINITDKTNTKYQPTLINKWLNIDQNRHRIDPESAQHRPKIDQDRPKIELGWGLGAIWAPRWPQEPTWPRNPDSLDPLGPPSWEPKLIKNQSRMKSRWERIRTSIFVGFLEASWEGKWSQDRSKKSSKKRWKKKGHQDGQEVA